MLEFRILGPIEVFVDGRPLQLGKGLERALLAVLVLSAGRPMSADELVSALWPERTPATATEMVRNGVARLRGRLGQEAIETTPAGYRLSADDDAVDIRRFEHLTASGSRSLEQGDAERAAIELSEALALWRGRPVPELDDTEAFAASLRALEELRIHAEEDRIEAELRLGRAPALIHELEALHAAHPYRERLLGQLMLALYQTGRQKEALDRYTAARRRLVDDVGLEPSPALQDLQHRILQQDPTLSSSLPAKRAVAVRNTGHRRLLLAAAAAVAIVGASAAVAAWPRGEGPAIPARGLVALDGNGRVKSAIPFAERPGLVAVDSNHVWVSSATSPTVVEVSLHGAPVKRSTGLPRGAFSLAASGGSVWAGNGFAGTISRINSKGRVVSTFRPEPHSEGRLPLVAVDGRLWVASQDGTLTRINPTTGRAIRTYRGIDKASAIAADGEHVWIAAATSDDVDQFDSRAGRIIRRIPVGGRPTAVAIGDGTVWALTPAESTLWRIDPKRGTVAGSIAVPASASVLATTPGHVWVAAGNSLLSLDTATNAPLRTQTLQHSIDDLAGFGGRIWASIG